MPESLPLIYFIVTFALLLLGFPVAFTLGGVSVLFGYFAVGPDFFNLLPLRIWGRITNVVLIAVPLFIYMGTMLEKSGIAEELLETMGFLFGKHRGGLAISVIVVGALLAASTGIVGATVVTMGLLSLPTMLKRNYSPALATGTIAASGTLGQIIPPSIVLVLLGSILNVDIGSMFMGAVIPGLMLVVLYIIYVVAVAYISPESAPAMPQDELKKFREKGMYKRIFFAFFLPTVLIIIVLGSIFAGIASPTESAAVGAIGASILTAMKKKFSLKVVKDVAIYTTHLTAMVFILLVGATSFGLIFRGMGGDTYITNLILGSHMSKDLFVFVIMLFVFIAGFFIDFIEITFIVVPIVAPIFHHFGFDMLWIGIIFAMNLQTSFLTPPFGFSLFYLKGVAPPSINIIHIYKGIVPYIIIQLIVLAIVILWPDTVIWLASKISY